jgi:hypothetical protein
MDYESAERAKDTQNVLPNCTYGILVFLSMASTTYNTLVK